MADGSLGILPWQTPFQSGEVIPGAKLFVYDAGTTTKRAIFTTSALAVQLTNPLVADSNGRFVAWWVDPSGGDYKEVLAPASDSDPPVAAIKTEDNIPAATISARPRYDLVAAEVSAGVTVVDDQYPPGYVDRYGINTVPGTTIMSSALAAAIAYANIAGSPVYFLAATYFVGTTTVVLSNNVKYIGVGKDLAGGKGTLIVYSGASDAVQINNPINSVTAANIHIQDIAITCTVATAGKAALADTGSTFLTLERCQFAGNKYGVILDQTEVSSITDCDFEVGTNTAGLWLVNGAQRTVGASPYFTNRITVERCQFNGTSGIGIADDGGSAHVYSNNNFNALTTQLQLSGVNVVTIDGNEFEPGAGLAVKISNSTHLGAGGTNPCHGVTINNNFFYSASAVAFLNFVDTSLSTLTTFENYYENANVSGKVFNAGGIGSVTKYTGWGNFQNGTGSLAVGNTQDSLNTITYSASMTPDIMIGDQMIITATNGTAFGILAPINRVAGQVFTITIRNGSGGALGAVSWGAEYKLAALTNPANGFSRSITFRDNGTNLVQIGQTGVDVPN